MALAALIISTLSIVLSVTNLAFLVLMRQQRRGWH